MNAMQARMRTKELSDCVATDITNGTSRYVSWQPGNGTRYDLVIADLRGHNILGCGQAGAWVVALTNLSEGCIVVPADMGFLHFNYLAGKLRGLQEPDAVIVAEALDYLLPDIEAVSVEEYLRDHDA